MGAGGPGLCRNRTQAGRHAGPQGMAGWGPRPSQQDGCGASFGGLRLPGQRGGELSSALGLLAPDLTEIRPGVRLNNVFSLRWQLYPRTSWGQGWAEKCQPLTPDPGCLSFPPQRSPKPPRGTEIPPSPGASMAETKGDQEGLSASVPGARGVQSFGTAWPRPLIPRAAPYTPALPSLQGARAPARS